MAQSSYSSGNSTSDLNKIVLDYLFKKGYSRTEAMLRLEISSVGAIPEEQQDWHIGASETYVQVYILLRDWIDGTLDLYKPKLQKVLYPIFVHSYLDLLQKNDPEMAIYFFESFRIEHEVLHGYDIRALAQLKTASDVEEIEIAQLYRKNKYRINFTRSTFDLLVQFLFENEVNGSGIIIRLLNQYIDIKITMPQVEGKEDPNVQAVYEMDEAKNEQTIISEQEGIPGHSEQLLDYNKQSIQLGLRPLSEEVVTTLKNLLEVKDKDVEGRNEALNKISHPAKNLVELLTEKENLINESTLESPSDPPLPPTKMKDIDYFVSLLESEQNSLILGKNATDPSVFMYTMHNTLSAVNCAAFSDDASMFALGCADSSIHLYSSTNNGPQPLVGSQNEPLQKSSLIGHTRPVFGVSISPQKEFILSCSEDGFTRLWSKDTKSTIVKYAGHNAPIWDVQFSPFGYYFATASHDQTARLWDVEHAAPLRVFVGHQNDVDCVSFHPNAAYLATGSSDHTTRMWDVRTGGTVRVFNAHHSPVSALCMSADGLSLASADESGIIKVWDLRSSNQHVSFVKHSSIVYSLSFSYDNKILVSGGADTDVNFWDLTYRNNLSDGEQSPLLFNFKTKNTIIQNLSFTRRNYCLALSSS